MNKCKECNEFGGYNQNIGVADLYGDSTPEVVSTYDMCYTGIIHDYCNFFSQERQKYMVSFRCCNWSNFTNLSSCR
ncbi:MAG: hypothetical protein GXY77_16680 [Fibrobacter sp.]|nr:hypothetical protein [Fibrobacter sp.]